MNFLVCSKISIPAKDRTLPAWEYLRNKGHQVWVEHPGSDKIPGKPDFIISMGITVMPETFQAMERFPDVPLGAFNWDTYAWVWTNPRPGEYDYKRYGELLKRAKEVWVPSQCTGLRTEQWWGITNWRVVLSAIPWWDCEDVHDEGYALCTLREIPDPWWGKFEQACEELRIPYRCTRHECSYEEYQKAVAHCRFLVSPLYELSTGGLTLLEGYYLGKPALLSNSPWHGGRDYLGDHARYFQHDSYDDFCAKLRSMYDDPPQLNRQECSAWVKENFSDPRMVDDMMKGIIQ